MFTDKAQAVIDLAKDYAFSSGSSELGLGALLAAMASEAEAGMLLAECVRISPEGLKAACVKAPVPARCPSKLPLAESLRNALVRAKEFAEQVPDRSHPALISLQHLACAIAGVAGSVRVAQHGTHGARRRFGAAGVVAGKREADASDR